MKGLSALIDEVKAAAEAERHELAAEVAEDLGRVVVPYSVDSEDAAAWVVNKLLAFDEEERRVRTQFERTLADIEKRRARFADHFLPELRRFFPAPEDGPRFLDLTTGRLSWRRTPADVVIEDRDRLLDFLEDKSPELVKVEPQPPKRTLVVDEFKRRARSLATTVINGVADRIGRGATEADAQRMIEERLAERLPPGTAYKPEGDTLSVSAPKK